MSLRRWRILRIGTLFLLGDLTGGEPDCVTILGKWTWRGDEDEAGDEDVDEDEEDEYKEGAEEEDEHEEEEEDEELDKGQLLSWVVVDTEGVEDKMEPTEEKLLDDELEEEDDDNANSLSDVWSPSNTW